MSRYYYFAATLPSLAFGAPPPLSSPEFLERAKAQLGEAEYAFLEGLSLVAEGPARTVSRVATTVAAWDRSLRNSLVLLRARRLGQDGSAWLRPDPEQVPGAERAALAALQASSPLEGELAIEAERWALLEGLAPFQSFDLESLAAYRLKLLVLERLQAFDGERGEAAYHALYAAILETAPRSPDPGVAP